MTLFKWESSHTVIKTGLHPIDGRVTITAWCLTESISMRIVILMTIRAFHGQWLVGATGVATDTIDARMPPLQWEPTHGIMIELQMPSRKPGLFVTAVASLSTKLPLVDVDMTPAAIVGWWSPFLPGVAIGTCIHCMFTTKSPTSR